MQCACAKIVKETIMMEMHLLEAFSLLCCQLAVQELQLFVLFEEINFLFHNFKLFFKL